MNDLNDGGRCEGHPAGPAGYQTRMECVNCQRRTAPRPAGSTWLMTPPSEYPCPQRIPAVAQ